MIQKFLSLLQKKSRFLFFSRKIRSLTDFKIFVDFSEFSNNFETNEKNACERHHAEKQKCLLICFYNRKIAFAGNLLEINQIKSEIISFMRIRIVFHEI